jgi:hypothetical protein
MNLDFQQILKRIGLLMDEMPPVKSGVLSVLAAKPGANGQIGLNYVVTICERMAFVCFGGWIPENPVKPSPTKSDQVRPNPTIEMFWISPAWFKTGMEAHNS